MPPPCAWIGGPSPSSQTSPGRNSPATSWPAPKSSAAKVHCLIARFTEGRRCPDWFAGSIVQRGESNRRLSSPRRGLAWSDISELRRAGGARDNLVQHDSRIHHPHVQRVLSARQR